MLLVQPSGWGPERFAVTMGLWITSSHLAGFLVCLVTFKTLQVLVASQPWKWIRKARVSTSQCVGLPWARVHTREVTTTPATCFVKEAGKGCCDSLLLTTELHAVRTDGVWGRTCAHCLPQQVSGAVRRCCYLWFRNELAENVEFLFRRSKKAVPTYLWAWIKMSLKTAWCRTWCDIFWD